MVNAVLLKVLNSNLSICRCWVLEQNPLTSAAQELCEVPQIKYVHFSWITQTSVKCPETGHGGSDKQGKVLSYKREPKLQAVQRCIPGF